MRFLAKRKIWLLSSLFFFLIPANIVLAGGEERAVDWFNAILNSISTGIASWMFEYLNEYVLIETDFESIRAVGPFFDKLMGYSMSLGIVCAVYFGVQEMFLNMLRAGMGQRTTPATQIYAKTIISGAMVVSVRYLLDLMIEINNYIISDISALQIQVDKIRGMFTLPEQVGADQAILFLIFVISALVLAFMGVVRYAEIASLYLFGPILMAADISASTMSHFFRTAIGIIFTQAAQVSILGLVFSTFTNQPNGSHYFITIGFIVLLLRGSKLLREWLYSTGVGDGAGAAAGQAVSFLALRARGGAISSLGQAAFNSLPIGGGGGAPRTGGGSGSIMRRG